MTSKESFCGLLGKADTDMPKGLPQAADIIHPMNYRGLPLSGHNEVCTIAPSSMVIIAYASVDNTPNSSKLTLKSERSRVVVWKNAGMEKAVLRVNTHSEDFRNDQSMITSSLSVKR